MLDASQVTQEANNLKFRRVLRQVVSLDPTAQDFLERFAHVQSRAEQVLTVGKIRPGNPATLKANRHIATENRRKRAIEMHAKIKPLLDQLRNEGKRSYTQMALALDEMGVPAPRAEKWNANTIRKIDLGLVK